MRKTDHIITNEKDLGFECLRCGAKYKMKLPALINLWLKKVKAFIELHKDCNELAQD